VLKVGKISVSAGTVFHDTKVREFFFLSFFPFLHRESTRFQARRVWISSSTGRTWSSLLFPDEEVEDDAEETGTENAHWKFCLWVLSAGIAAVACLLAQETDKPCQCPAPWTVLYAKHPIGLTTKNLNLKTWMGLFPFLFSDVVWWSFTDGNVKKPIFYVPQKITWRKSWTECSLGLPCMRAGWAVTSLYRWNGVHCCCLFLLWSSPIYCYFNSAI